MSARGFVCSAAKGRDKASVHRSQERPRTSRANKVLAERNPPVVAVGAWVEGGQDFLEHPCALALLTDEIQAERRREKEESLRRFQDEVRHRLAQQAQISSGRQQAVVKPGRRLPQVKADQVRANRGEKLTPMGAAAHYNKTVGNTNESCEDIKQIRLRLAACRMIPQEEMTSDLPGGRWNISPTRHGVEEVEEEEVEEEDVEEEEKEEEEEVEDDRLFPSQHEHPFVHLKPSSPVLMGSHKSQPDSGFQSNPPRVLWPLTDPDEPKRQRLSQFLMHRRLYMNIEREQVKENRQHRKHLKRTASIKAEKEQLRLQEERRLERARQQTEARQRLEERELLIQERLKLEEEERAAELQRRKKDQKGKVAARFIDALRAKVKERLPREKLEQLPPLCCCASSFWDSHPDTCANNCIFHNNPKAYAKALHSAMQSLDLH
ncbi:uncharacterized protein V6R79_020838 [Siganus canaliculatus]